jgi:hypothetical protein
MAKFPPFSRLNCCFCELSMNQELKSPQALMVFWNLTAKEEYCL